LNSFPAALNTHYDFDDLANLAVIKAVEAYKAAFETNNHEFLVEAERTALGGRDGYDVGVNVISPWGNNTVTQVEKNEQGQVIKCIKEIVVKPGFMLSLQRHLGREELWEVQEGTLTVIKNGERIEVNNGECISLKAGDVHCMNNLHNKPVKVRETQTGRCADADNVRLVDFSGRGVYPLTNETEFQSAKIYARLQMEILQEFGPTVNVSGREQIVRFRPPQALLAV
jgi:mannose-6-phosphate isomerase-like protein (cupin superfamily)